MIYQFGGDAGVAFANLASLGYARLNDEYQKNGRKVEIGMIGKLAPIIVNYTFALELLIKVLSHQCGVKPKNVHDVSKLFDKLPEDLKLKASNIFSAQLKLQYESKGFLHDIYMIFDNTIEKKNFPKDISLFDALVKMDKSFVQWRYIYEFDELKEIFFHFMEAMAAITAINKVSADFKGTHVEVIKKK